MSSLLEKVLGNSFRSLPLKLMAMLGRRTTQSARSCSRSVCHNLQL